MNETLNIEEELGNVEIIHLKIGEWYDMDDVAVCYEATLLVDGKIVLLFTNAQGSRILKTARTEIDAV